MERNISSPSEIEITQTLIKTKDKNGLTILNNKYRILSKLGQGSQAKVKLAELMNDSLDYQSCPQYFAIKIFFKPYLRKQRSIFKSSSKLNGTRRRLSYTTALDEVYQEISIMQKLDHANIIRLYEVLDDPLQDKLYLVMPVADCGEILELDDEKLHFVPNKKVQFRMSSKAHKLCPLDSRFYKEEFIRNVAKDLIYALDYLHNELNVVHRDIKPSNILVDEAGSPLLVDFGKAKQLACEEEDMTTSIQGTYQFLPPECCAIDNEQQYSMKKADIWALGMTLYCLTFNNLPFQGGDTELSLMENICKVEISYDSREISNELKELLEAMLAKDPLKRNSLEELKQMRFLNEQTELKKISKKDYEKNEDSLESQKFIISSFSLLNCCSEGSSPSGSKDCSFDM